MLSRLLISCCLVTAVFLGLAGQASAVAQGKMVEVILDCSGSMKSKLPWGESRIEAAKKAVETIVLRLDKDIVLAFRAYGHQSPTAKHNC